MVVLDAARLLQAGPAPDLAVRWNCKAGKCGSCGAEVNGRPRLMCMTRIDSLPEAPVTIAPMRAFALIRDLVVDMDGDLEKARTIPPFRSSVTEPASEARMSREDGERLRALHDCIECGLCQDVCHVLRDHPENRAAYLGPRHFVRIAALEMNPLDDADRDSLIATSGLSMCNTTRCCTEVCPEGIPITDDAIIPLKERQIDRHHDPIGRFVGWLSRRTPPGP